VAAAISGVFMPAGIDRLILGLDHDGCDYSMTCRAVLR
jgi:hypothetical protein